jgi:predicted enzyme related to lactoylglutathione lyase
MSESTSTASGTGTGTGTGHGKVVWHDLTVPDAEKVRDFYSAVIGWTAEDVDMGGYSDFNMQISDSGETVAGICHARGGNTELPPVWMVYLSVADIEESARKVVELGGKLLTPIKGDPGAGAFCVIQDPAGAIVALLG